MADKWGSALDDYAAAMLAGGMSPGTVRLYRYRLLLIAEQHPDPWKVTTGDLQRCMTTSAWKPETRKTVRSAFRSFFRWGHEAGHVDDDPTLRLKGIRIPQAVPRPAPEDVLATALATAEPRVVMMVRLAAFGGLRAAEIACVHANDVVGDVLFVTGKGGKTRPVPMGGSDPELLAQIHVRGGWAFPNGLGGHLTPGRVSRLMSVALPDGWTAHTLRHRFGTTAYAGSRDLLAVGALLGHTRPETTQRYVAMPDDALRAAIRHTRRESKGRQTPAECRQAVVDAARAAGFIPADEARERFDLTYTQLAALLDDGEISMVNVCAFDDYTDDEASDYLTRIPVGTSLLRVADLERATAVRPALRLV